MMPSPDRSPARWVRHALALTAPQPIRSDRAKTFLTRTAPMATPITGSNRRGNNAFAPDAWDTKLKSPASHGAPSHQADCRLRIVRGQIDRRTFLGEAPDGLKRRA